MYGQESDGDGDAREKNNNNNIVIIYGRNGSFLTWLATSSTSRGKSRSTVISASPRGQCSK